MICPDCGDEADDFGPCGCLASRSGIRREFTPGKPNGAGAMREMVRRKLEKRR